MKLSEIFERLQIPPENATVFLHIYYTSLKPHMGIGDILRGLDQYFDASSTICMPSYPFSGAEWFNYLKHNPVFDVKKTPCRVNLVCEFFRRTPRTHRSIHPWCSVASKGKMAEYLTAEHHLDTATFGPKSPFQKIAHNGGFVIGIGFDCRMNAFAHLPDLVLQKYLPFPVFESGYTTGQCIDSNGNAIKVVCDVLDKNIGRRIKPQKMQNILRKTNFYREITYNNVQSYAMKIEPFVKLVTAENLPLVQEGKMPLYYE